MAGFVLIHGSFCGGWYFDRVAELLRAAGHAVDAPDLPGMGGDEAALAAVTLDQWAEFALDRCMTMRAKIGDAPLVLAGHSRGGIVIGAAAEANPSAMDKLVYIAALMPPAGESGMSVREKIPGGPELQRLTEAAMANPQGGFDPELAADAFAQLAPRHVALAAARRLAAEPMGPLMTPMTITPERWGSVARLYVECVHDLTISIEGQRLMQRLSPGGDVVTLESDHSPSLSMPEKLAEVLAAATG